MVDENYKEFLGVEDVAKQLGVYRTTVYNYIKSVKTPLPAIRISKRKILVKKVDLDTWLNNFKNKGGENTKC